MVQLRALFVHRKFGYRTFALHEKERVGGVVYISRTSQVPPQLELHLGRRGLAGLALHSNQPSPTSSSQSTIYMRMTSGWSLSESWAMKASCTKYIVGGRGDSSSQRPCVVPEVLVCGGHGIGSVGQQKKWAGDYLQHVRR